MKTIKIYHTILLLSILAIAENARAQSLEVFGGLNFSGMKHKLNGDTQESKMRTGYQIGLGVLIPLNKDYYKDKDGFEMTGIYPSLQLIRKGLKKTTLIDPINTDVKLNYLQFSLPFYTRSGSYGIGLGPYAAYAISGKTEYTSITGGNRKINFGNNAAADFKSLDYGLSLTMSLSIFYFQYDLGMANIGAGKYGTAKNRNFSVGILIPLVNRYE